MADVALTELEKDSTTPEYRHRKKLLEEQLARKKENVATDTWYEHLPNARSKKGGKVYQLTRMKNGSKYRVLIGHASQCEQILKDARKSGKLRPFGWQSGDAKAG